MLSTVLRMQGCTCHAGDAGREGGYVLKRIRSDGGKQDGRRLSLLREAYFGRLINNLAAHLDLGSQQGVPLEWDGRNHVVRYVESFEVRPHSSQQGRGRSRWHATRCHESTRKAL